MLGFRARFAEYGITGGFFLVTQLLIFGVFFPVVHIESTRFTYLADLIKNNAVLAPAIQTLVISLSILSIFLIGLALDLLGSPSSMVEERVFRDKLSGREKWVEKLIRADLPDYEDEYRAVTERKQTDGESSFLAILRQIWQSHQLFRRVEFILVAKVLASNVKTEMLADNISMCRISRGIATTLFILYIEVTNFGARHYQESSQYLLPFGGLINFIFSFVLFFLLGALLFAIAYLITLAAYSRFTLTLFSLLYSIWITEATSQEQKSV